MSDQGEIQGRLFKEKCLADILRSFESAFPVPIDAKWQSAFAFGAAAVAALFYYNLGEPMAAPIQKMIAQVIGFGVVLSTAVLGVAIAGFSIFASSLDSEVLERLAFSDRKPELSNLSFIFASFIYVLVTLFLVLVTSLIYIAFLGGDSLFFASLLSSRSAPELVVVLLLAFGCLYAAQMVFVFSILKSFILNLHQVLMLVAAAKILEKRSKK